jgi:hypothetical protein
MNKNIHIFSNIDPKCCIKNDYLLKNILDGSILLEDIPEMTPQKIFPEHWKILQDKQKARDEFLYLKKPEAATDEFKCSKCKQRKCTYYELQTRSIDEPMTSIFTSIKPRWIALSSLFYEGDITATIVINEHQRSRKTFYNVYSIPELNRLAKQHGYFISNYEKFDIDVDLPKPTDIDFMSTYTERLMDVESIRRIQISGPLLMNWYFIMLQAQEV